MYSSICGNLFLVVVLHEIYARLEEKVESVCHGYMCILLYVKLICVVRLC